MKKKIIAVLLALSVVVSCLSIAFSAYASTLTITNLDSTYSLQTNGSDDMVRFKFTPSATGVYSFMSFNTRSCIGYLFIRSTREDGTRYYEQLDCSTSNPNYKEDGQINEQQFRITHHLIAGTTYYFGAEWASTSLSEAMMNVKIRCDSYDDNIIDHIDVTCPAKLQWYTDGEWVSDASGNMYFRYNYSKITQNMTVTIWYVDGTSSSQTGSDTIDGYPITYSHNQNEEHWYVLRDDNCKGNYLTVSVLGKSTQYNVEIEETGLYSITGRVVDYVDGTPVQNANVYLNGAKVTQYPTDENGNFNFAQPAGMYNATIEAPNAITRSFTIVVSSNPNDNKFAACPVGIVVGDYVKDGIVNTKDFAYSRRYLSLDEKKRFETNIKSMLDFRQSKYPALTLQKSSST